MTPDKKPGIEDKKDIVKPITLVIDKKLWYEYKMGVPRDTTINNSLVELIRKDVFFKRTQKRPGIEN